MGTFFQPPPPIVSPTGAQPYAQGKLSPGIPGQSVDNPPVVSEGRYPNATPNIILTAWISDPSYYTFVGGLQPFDSRNLNAAFEAVPVNNPPGIGVCDFVELPDPLPQQPGRFNPAVFAPPAAPQFRFDISGILSAWQPDPLPSGYGLARPKQLNPQLLAVEVDNPPGLLTDVIFYDVGRRLPPQYLWRGPLNPQLTAVPVNNPPATYPKGTRQLRFAWQPPDPQPQQLRAFVVQPFTAPSAQVPFTASWLPSVLGAWQLPDPPPVQKGPLNPQLTIAATVGTLLCPGIPNIVTVPDDPLPQQLGKLNPGLFPPAVVNNPPFGGSKFISWGWGPATVSAQSGGAFIQSVDNPPGLVSGAYSFWLETVLNAWVPVPGAGIPQPQILGPFVTPSGVVPTTGIPSGVGVPKFVIVDDALPQLPPQVAALIPPAVVNNPPRFRFDLSGILTAWQPPDPPPVQRGPLNPQLAAVQVNNPPFPGQNGNWLTTVLVSWRPPDPPPVQKGPLNPQITAVSVNNPPFTNQGRTAQYWQAMAAWEIPLPPQPQQTKYIITIIPPPPPVKELHDHPFFATFGKMTVH